ncbi:MAG: hypothetical protein WD708_09125 [Kiritimatiellia bacterium]
MNSVPTTDVFPKARPSASADQSRAAELARLRAMTVEERMRLALSLHRQFSGLKPHKVES